MNLERRPAGFPWSAWPAALGDTTKTKEGPTPNMTRNKRVPAATETLHNSNSSSRSVATRVPTIVIEIPIEQPPTVRVNAETFEDERRVSLWLAQPAAAARVIDRLRAVLLETLTDG